jgi:hypothetical protein
MQSGLHIISEGLAISTMIQKTYMFTNLKTYNKYTKTPKTSTIISQTFLTVWKNYRFLQSGSKTTVAIYKTPIRFKYLNMNLETRCREI